VAARLSILICRPEFKHSNRIATIHRCRKESTEVPLDRLRVSLVRQLCSPQESEDVLGVGSINITSLHQRCSWQAVLINVELLDFCSRSGFLFAELVAWEKQHHEARARIFIVQADQARNLADVSETGHIHHKDHLASEALKQDFVPGIVPRPEPTE
jgi:hypothetical protein